MALRHLVDNFVYWYYMNGRWQQKLHHLCNRTETNIKIWDAQRTQNMVKYCQRDEKRYKKILQEKKWSVQIPAED